MAIDLGNGFVVSGPAFGEKTKTDADRRQEVLKKYGGVQGVANSGISFDKLLEELSGLRWDIPLFDTITAGQAIGAYQNGTLPTPQQGKEAVQSGAYNGTYQDYMNENIAKATGVEHTKGSGNQTLDDLNNAVGAAPSGSSSGTSYLDQLTAIQNSGNAPSANMQGWADSFINKLGKAQSGGDSKEDAFNKMWASYAEGNPDHASPELQAALRQGKDYNINDVVLGPAALLIAPVVASVLYVIKPKNYFIRILPVVAAVIGLWKYLSHPAFSLGSYYAIHLISIVVMLIVGAVNFAFAAKAYFKK